MGDDCTHLLRHPPIPLLEFLCVHRVLRGYGPSALTSVRALKCQESPDRNEDLPGGEEERVQRRRGGTGRREHLADVDPTASSPSPLRFSASRCARLARDIRHDRYDENQRCQPAQAPSHRSSSVSSKRRKREVSVRFCRRGLAVEARVKTLLAITAPVLGRGWQSLRKGRPSKPLRRMRELAGWPACFPRATSRPIARCPNASPACSGGRWTGIAESRLRRDGF
jgi:hypothetical protein